MLVHIADVAMADGMKQFADASLTNASFLLGVEWTIHPPIQDGEEPSMHDRTTSRAEWIGVLRLLVSFITLSVAPGALGGWIISC